MTGKRVSAEQLKVMTVFVAEPKGWFNASTIERKTDLPASSIRHFLYAFSKLKLLERAEVHGGYRYRLSPTAEAQPYFDKLREAAVAIEH
jgi:DNA-binding IclR family transcriptional regulator